MFDLSGKVAVVTGGSRGIGAATARALVLSGASVVVNFRRQRSLAEDLVRDLEALRRGKAMAVKADVSRQREADGLIATALDAYGRLDILVNNAGTIADGLLLSLTAHDWNRVLRTNLKAPVYCAQAALREMVLQHSGAIIHVSSIAARRPNKGQSNYAASKGALEALSRSISTEFGRKGIRSNCVAPGIIATEMSADLLDTHPEIAQSVPVGRLGRPSDVAAAVVYLASDEASFISGEVLHIDGGMV